MPSRQAAMSAPRHSPATAPHPLALDGCRQVSELLAEQALEAAKAAQHSECSTTTDRVYWQIWQIMLMAGVEDALCLVGAEGI